VTRRTGVTRQGSAYLLPFWRGPLLVDPATRTLLPAGGPAQDLGFRVCLTALLYLISLDPAALGAPASPLELTGGATFFRGLHGLPHAPLEARFGQDAEAFRQAASRLGGEPRAEGDSAFAFTVFPGLRVEVILWLADEELPAQASFTVPAHLDRFWQLDAIWGLLNLVAQDLLAAAPAAP
jgi:hypothetical protein